jgi:hypothetical protein
VIDGKTTIEIALKAKQVAKRALEFTDSTQTAMILRMRYKLLVDDVHDLCDTIQKAILDMEE